MIKAVLFDAGGTLVSPNPSVGAIYAQVARGHGIDAHPDELNRRFEAAWRARKDNRRSIEKAWWKELVTEVFEVYPAERRASFFDDLYDAFKEARFWRVFPEVRETLEAVRAMGLKTAVASNWDERLPPLLDALNLAPLFDRQFVSYFVGRSKPDPDFFRHAVRELGLRPAEVFHVGDDAEEDLGAATMAGLRAALIDRRRAADPPERIADLREILSLIA